METRRARAPVACRARKRLRRRGSVEEVVTSCPDAPPRGRVPDRHYPAKCSVLDILAKRPPLVDITAVDASSRKLISMDRTDIARYPGESVISRAESSKRFRSRRPGPAMVQRQAQRTFPDHGVVGRLRQRSVVNPGSARDRSSAHTRHRPVSERLPAGAVSPPGFREAGASTNARWPRRPPSACLPDLRPD